MAGNSGCTDRLRIIGLLLAFGCWAFLIAAGSAWGAVAAADPASSDFVQEQIPRDGRTFRIQLAYRF